MVYDIPYIRLLLKATAGGPLGDLLVFLQHGGPHHVHITVQVVQQADEDIRRRVEVDENVSPSSVPFTVFGDLVRQQPLSQALQVSDHRSPLHQSLHGPPHSGYRLRPLHGLQDQGQLVARHGFGEIVLVSECLCSQHSDAVIVTSPVSKATLLWHEGQERTYLMTYKSSDVLGNKNLLLKVEYRCFKMFSKLLYVVWFIKYCKQ